MGVEIIPRINRKLSIGKMAIASTFFRTASRPMFYHSVHAIITPTIIRSNGSRGRLKAIHIGTGHIDSQSWILPKSANETIPSRFGSQIDLWRQSCGDTQRTIFFGGDGSELPGDGRIKCG